jgi:hypothetical protein
MGGAGNINDQVAHLLLGASARSLDTPKEFDLMEMPLEGVAAFWLSVKKTLDSRKKGDGFLLEEARHTREPHVRFLLELAASSFPPARCEELAQVRKKNILAELQRKYVLMAIGLLGIVSKENPQKVMIRFLSKFHIAPIFEKQVFEVAQVMLKNLDNSELNKAKFLNIDHKLKIEALPVLQGRSDADLRRLRLRLRQVQAEPGEEGDPGSHGNEDGPVHAHDVGHQGRRPFRRPLPHRQSLPAVTHPRTHGPAPSRR